MKYAIDFRNMHTAIHGLVLFNSKKEAENAYDLLKTQDEANIEMALNHSHAVIEEINFRHLKEMEFYTYSINENGNVHPITNNVRIINYNQSIDLFI